MSATSEELFDAGSAPLDALESGTSVLLTGEDADAIEAVFAALSAPAENERSVLIDTDNERSLQRAYDGEQDDASDRLLRVTADGSARGDNVEQVDSLGDLTQLGMVFSDLAMTAQQDADRFRSGIYICSSICQEADDFRSVYRFINTNFLSDLRRSDAVGVCAVNTAADLQTDVESMVKSMESSFDIHVEVTDADRRSATLEVSGDPSVAGTHEMSL